MIIFIYWFFLVANEEKKKKPLLYWLSWIVHDELEIYDRHKSEIVINKEKTLHIYYTHWWQRVTNGAMITE